MAKRSGQSLLNSYFSSSKKARVELETPESQTKGTHSQLIMVACHNNFIIY